MISPRNEAELRLIASALQRGDEAMVLHGEQVLLEPVRVDIRDGGDPLGDWFCGLRTVEHRRSSGATYTPAAIVAAMVSWAEHQPHKPSRIIDPGSGSGRFLWAAARKFPDAELVAVEIDPLARELIAANAAVHGVSERLKLVAEDYRSFTPPDINGSTLYIGNPPYVRHHDLGETWKDWLHKSAKELGFKASRLAGLHIHFFLRTRQIAKRGDFGVFITAAEWVDVNYGSVLREMLADGMGGVALHLIDPKAQPFPDAMATGAITCFRVGNRPQDFTMRMVSSLAELGALSSGESFSWEQVTSAPRWSPLIRSSTKKDGDLIELGEIFRVHRGTVTGLNEVWIARAGVNLPDSVLHPAVTKAREIIAAGATLSTAESLRSVIDIPASLDQLDPADRKRVEKFLKWAKAIGAHETYTARHRRAWWNVGLRAPAPILATYMGRRPPAFTHNAARARFINIAHGLYPREPLSHSLINAYVHYLHNAVQIGDGRAYAGGLVKFEPKELERVLVPKVEHINEVAAGMVERGNHSRRGNSARSLPAFAS